MYKKQKITAIIAIAVAMAFVMPVAAVANFGTIGVISDSEITGDMEIMVESTTNSDTIDNNTESTVNTVSFDNDFSSGTTRYVGGTGTGNYSHIQDAINNSSDGDTVYIYDDSSPYYEYVIVNKSIALEGESEESVVIVGTGVGSVVEVTANGTSISKFTVGEGYNGIWFNESSNNVITHCTVYNNSYGGIYLYPSSNNTEVIKCTAYNNDRGIYARESSNTKIIDCTAYNNSRGIYLYKTSTSTNVVNCTSYNNTQYGIYLWSSSDHNSDCNIIDCNAYNNGRNGISLMFSANNNNITNCNAYNNADDGIFLTGSSNNNITNCNVYNNADDGIYLCDSSNDNNITNCNVYNHNNGIHIHGSSNSITNCNVYNNAFSGIHLMKNPNSNITNCNIYNNTNYGIFLYYNSNSNITNCNVYNNDYGFYIYIYSSNNNIKNCNAYNNTQMGIYLTGSSNNNVITNCNVYNNANHGIHLEGAANNNVITRCNVYNNTQYGIYLMGSSNGNSIRHNNIVNNAENAYDNSVNQWDDGSEGNYWSDYTGVDEDGDGIGDTPYNITGKSPPNQDRYPLMIPWDETPPVITDVQATPAAQTTTDPVNITCTVTDNKEVDTVKVIITGPEGFTLEEEMNEGSYWYEDTYTTLGVYYYYIWADDTRGNEVTSATYTFVITDFDKPVSTVAPLSQWTKTTPFTVTATAFDNTGVATVTLWYQYSSDGTEWTDWTSYGTDTEEPWSWSFTGSDGYYEFYSIAVDDYGNIEDPPDVADATTGIDTVPPVTTIELDGTMGENDWYVSNVDVTLSATDTLSGIETTFYQIDSEYPELYTAPFTVTGDKEHTVQYYSFDNALNREDANTIDLKIDTTPPITTHEFEGLIGSGGWFVTDVTVTLDAADATAGVDYTMYNLDGDWITYTEPFIVTEDDEYTLCYYSVDLAGIVEVANEVDFKIEHDITPPVTTHVFEGVMGDNDWFTSNVAVTLSADDDSAGVDYTMYKLNEGEWTEYTGAFLVTEDAEYTLYYYSVDKVGNTEDPTNEAELKIDQTPPTIDLDAEEMSLGKWLLIATVSDITSGIAKVEFYVNGELLGEVTEAPYEWEVTNPQTGDKGQAIVYDNAGNQDISEEIDAVSQSQSQSSSSPVPWLFSWLFGLW